MPSFHWSLAAIACAILPATQAVAQSWLRSAVLPVNSTFTMAPPELTIAFTKAVESRFSTIEVTGANAVRVDGGRPRLTGGDAIRLSVGLQNLSPGTYTVIWHATSVDIHKSYGTHRFTLAASDTSGVSLEHVWARPTVGHATTGAVYFTITNNGNPDHLIGASTPIATKAESHETINDNGVMKMRAAPSIALESGKPVTFKPSGYHVMLTGLKGALKAGDSFPLTLTFEHAQPITVTVKVEAAGGGAMDHGTMPGMQGH